MLLKLQVTKKLRIQFIPIKSTYPDKVSKEVPFGCVILFWKAPLEFHFNRVLQCLEIIAKCIGSVIDGA